MSDLDPMILAAGGLVAVFAGLTLFLALRLRRVQRPPGPAPALPRTPAAVPVDAPPVRSGHPVEWGDPVLDEITHAVHRHAFGVSSIQSYAAAGEHADVLERVRRGIPEAATRREFFPRKPQVVPRLLSAIRNSESSLKELVEIIMRDPVLTGDVLRMANSPFYRGAKEPVDTIGRAVVLLGMDGLRMLVANSVMQPVFQVPRGYFESFSPTVWRQAQHSAIAAQTYARATRECDSFSAHLLALLFHMSHIVLFRMTVASYIQAAGALPRADVFARLQDECAESLAYEIATEWELAESMSGALAEHVQHKRVNEMSPLGRALYFGRICGAAVVAVDDAALEEGAVLELLSRKDLAPEHAGAIWEAARAFESEAT